MSITYSDVLRRRDEVKQLRAEGMTLDEIGRHMGISGERVRQILSNDRERTERKIKALQGCVDSWNEWLPVARRTHCYQGKFVSFEWLRREERELATTVTEIKRLKGGLE